MDQNRCVVLSALLGLGLWLAPAVADDCPPPGPDAVVPATEEERLALIGRARVFTEDPRGGRSLLEGPLQPDPGQALRTESADPV